MANFNFNKVIIGGRLTGDPELKTTASGVSVTSFSVDNVNLMCYNRTTVSLRLRMQKIHRLTFSM